MLGIFLDLETTGLNYKHHRTIEIAFQIINLYSNALLHEYSQIIFQPRKVWRQSNPKSLAINGFTEDMISSGKLESQVQKEIIELFKKYTLLRDNSVFICQNPSFDRIFFSQIIDPDIQEECRWPYHWLDLASMHWGIQILQKKISLHEIGLTKNQIAKFYGLQEEKFPHRALQGVKHLVSCYRAMMSGRSTTGQDV